MVSEQTLDVVEAISNLLGTALDRPTLTSCFALIEDGVSPEALAAAILKLRAEERKLASDMGRRSQVSMIGVGTGPTRR